MAPSIKHTPTCHDCGRYTCTDCGEGFATRDAYLRHRLDAQAHAGGEPEPAPA